MATDPLVSELDALLGSRHEARWIADEVAAVPDAERSARALELARRRRAGEPLQYVLGHWPFRTLDLVVDARALVPRPETEQLVGLALERLGTGRSDPTVASDLGTGSGAIALSLAVECAVPSQLEVHATDDDAGALELAALNAGRVGTNAVSFHLGSWYDALPDRLSGRVDLVCSNPPYVSAAERKTLARELDFEPEHALVSDDGTDGTAGFGAVERVVLGAGAWLAPGGWLMVEHGDRHRDAALACALGAGFCDVADHDDLSGRPRFLVARQPR